MTAEALLQCHNTEKKKNEERLMQPIVLIGLVEYTRAAIDRAESL